MDEPWDPDKARANLRKHGVSFDEAKTLDKRPTTHDERDGSVAYEDRRRLTGFSSRDRILVVACVYRGGNIRPISARRATKRETIEYFIWLGLSTHPIDQAHADLGGRAAGSARRPPSRRRRVDH